MRLLKNAYEQNLAQCIARAQSADFSHKFFDQLLSYTGASALAVKLVASWRALIQSYSVWFPAVTTPDPRSNSVSKKS